MNEPKRKITDEARAAETELQRFEDKFAAELKRNIARVEKLDTERAGYIAGLPDDVRNMLVAGGVIEVEEP